MRCQIFRDKEETRRNKERQNFSPLIYAETNLIILIYEETSQKQGETRRDTEETSLLKSFSLLPVLINEDRRYSIVMYS